MADPSTTPIIGVAADPLTISSSNTTALAQLLLFGNKLYPFLPTYAHLLVAALLPIYAGAHASLARPNNVRPIEKKKRNAEKKPAPSSDESGDGEEEEEEEEAQPVENLTAKDAMLFPVTAGLMLGLLYVIIKYLKDPTLLSRILTYYFIIMGAAAVGTFCADGLGVVVNVVFPRKWRGRNTGGGLYVAGHNQYHYHDKAIKGTVVPEKEQANPFPRSFIPVPKSLYKPIWALRRKLLAKWAVVIKLGTGPASKTNVIRKTFWVGDLVGLACGVGCVLGYVFTGKHWVASNLMGVSFAYSAMRLISPTTFSTATLLLSLLFFYDIYFVFYTPLMVTVATNLDVPIKLLFPRPQPASAGPEARTALAMLGLGDVVLPGIMIGMALRFDFWRWNETRKKEVVPGSSKSTLGGTSSEKVPAEESTVILPRYIKATGTWGERLWYNNSASSTSSRPSAVLVGGVFPKTYFYASIVGYILGMVATLLVMHIWNHAQPALLYLVPGVLGAVWGTGLVRGELAMMWRYTEEDPEKEKEEREEEKKEKERMRRAEEKARKLVEEKEEEAGKGEGEKASKATTGYKKMTSPAHGDKPVAVRSTAAIEEESSPSYKKAESTASPTATGNENDEMKEKEENDEDIDTVDDFELVNERGETEYLTVLVVKKPAFGAATKREGGKGGEEEKEKEKEGKAE